MKKLLYSLIVIAFTSCGKTRELNLPDGIEYSIIDEDQNVNLEKTNINILINKKVDKTILKVIAEKLKSERSGFKNLWIFYYLPNMKVGSGSWATSHFSPDLEIKILGSTIDEDKSMQDISNIGGEILGKWKSDQSLMGAVFILYINNENKMMMRMNMKSGNPIEVKITKSQEKGLIRYDDGNKHGEYYILEKNGNLGLYSEEGKFDEAVKIK